MTGRGPSRSRPRTRDTAADLKNAQNHIESFEQSMWRGAIRDNLGYSPNWASFFELGFGRYSAISA